MIIATIGFTQSTAEHFFERLKRAGVRRVLDVRLHNSSQLAGFSKYPDIAYLVRVICGAVYEHDRRLAPSEELFAAIKKAGLPWPDYERRFSQLMQERGVPDVLDRAAFSAKTALLCTEPRAEQCHRRLVAGLLAEQWGAEVVHL